MTKKRYSLWEKDSEMKKRRTAPSDDSFKSNSMTESNLTSEGLITLYKLTPTKKTEPSHESKEESIGNVSLDNISTPKAEADKETLKTPSGNFKKNLKKKTLTHSVKYPSETFDDVGGLENTLLYILGKFVHLKEPQLFEQQGVPPPRGFLLHGPPGCGKTHIAHAIAGELKLPMIEVAAPELVCGISGESEGKIRELFEDGLKNAPCILFIDEIDAVSPKRETSDRGMERRIVSQLLKCMDDLNKKDVLSRVLVIGATNLPDSIDTALRRGGRFDREIAIGIPDEPARLMILRVLCKKLKMSAQLKLEWLARNTPGYVGADLKMVITEAVEAGIWRMFNNFINSYRENNSSNTSIQDSRVTLEAARSWFRANDQMLEEEKEKLCFEQQDFELALQRCVPYSKREGFATIPDVTWDDVGALDDIKEQLQEAILWPIKYRELYEKSRTSSTKGILLCGPKGCGKTLLAKAIANECSINFLSVKGPELLSMYLGESEKAVRQCFQRARSSAPCVIFFDEIDALCPSRSGSNTNAAAERVVNQLLTEMDGMEDRKQVFVMAATNRPGKIDTAMLRPGRLEKIIFVDIPCAQGRVHILNSITKNKTRPKIADDVELQAIGSDARCEGFSGADLAYLVRAAFSKAMRDYVREADTKEDVQVQLQHFEHAFSVVKPSVTEKDRKHFKQTLSM